MKYLQCLAISRQSIHVYCLPLLKRISTSIVVNKKQLLLYEFGVRNVFLSVQFNHDLLNITGNMVTRMRAFYKSKYHRHLYSNDTTYGRIVSLAPLLLFSHGILITYGEGRCWHN